MNVENSSYNHANVLVEDLMTELVSVIKPEMTISQAVHLMLRQRVSGYPVVDEEHRVIGLVTISDFFILLEKLIEERKEEKTKGKETSIHEKIEKVKDEPVSRIMSTDVISITPQTTLIEVIEATAHWRIHTFPVIENEKLVGIIGRHDILNATFLYG